MENNWKYTEKVIEDFNIKNKDRIVYTEEAVRMYINPQKIIAINNNYSYPDILNDYKMQILRESVKKNNWINKNVENFSLLMLPNGDLLVNGGGNHRAVLAKELSIPSVKAMVHKVVYIE